MFGAIRHNLTHLADFRGRDGRRTFWLYLLAVALLNLALSLAVTVPIILQTMAEAAQVAPGDYDTGFVQAFARNVDRAETMAWFVAATVALNLVLLSAAGVRRLHDADRSGWWALFPVVLELYAAERAFAQLRAARAHLEQMMTSGIALDELVPGQAVPSGMFEWLAIALVIVVGLLRPTAGPNRFGAEPARR